MAEEDRIDRRNVEAVLRRRHPELSESDLQAMVEREVNKTRKTGAALAMQSRANWSRKKFDEADKAVADAAWRVDCLSQRMDACEQERADAVGYSASELKKLVNSVDYAMTSLKQAGTSAEARGHKNTLQNAMRLLEQAVPARQDRRFEQDRQEMLRWAKNALAASSGVDYDRGRGNRMASARGFGAAAND